ncbi:MAG TPA: hypothetical protein VGA13_09410 [Acidimicrobiales bacterium]
MRVAPPNDSPTRWARQVEGGDEPRDDVSEAVQEDDGMAVSHSFERHAESVHIY